MFMIFERARTSFDLIDKFGRACRGWTVGLVKLLFTKSNANEEIVAYDGFVYDEAEVMA